MISNKQLLAILIAKSGSDQQEFIKAQVYPTIPEPAQAQAQLYAKGGVI